jgi:hypothetical protein
MSRKIKILYFANLAIILLGLVSPVIELIVRGRPPESLLMSYYAVLIALSMTFCVTFLALNVYAVLKYKTRKARYYAISATMLIWIFCGVYQFAYGYTP